MKRVVVAICIAACSLAFAATSTAPEYFKYVRAVRVERPDVKNYFVVDRTMWENMRPDLGDMRLYSETTEIPYAVEVQRGGRSLLQETAKMLDLGERGGSTEFKLQVSTVEYDTITLKLKTHNFNTQAVVEGSDDGATWRKLATATIFDFSDEKLGCNFEIRLPAASRFGFLRVTIQGRVPAKDVEGASVATLKDRDAAWFSISTEARRAEDGRDTVFEWDAPPIPLERVKLAVGAPALNFYRNAELMDGEGRWIGSAELSRVHIRRGGRSMDKENLVLDVPHASRAKHYKLVIHNGDDHPLPITAIEPQSYERRVHFLPQSRTDFRLYFGDAKTEVPSYDFARYFRDDPAAVQAGLEPSTANALYKGRPDDRPWSEKNKWVLWSALIIAVLGLGAIALRGLKAA